MQVYTIKHMLPAYIHAGMLYAVCIRTFLVQTLLKHTRPSGHLKIVRTPACGVCTRRKYISKCFADRTNTGTENRV